MRTDKKISKKAIVVSYNGTVNALYIRKPGKNEFFNGEKLLEVLGDEIRINSDAAEMFGLQVVMR